MSGYVQDLRRFYEFEKIDVEITRPMQRLQDDAEELGRRISELEAERSSKLADFERIKANRQVEVLKGFYWSAHPDQRIGADHLEQFRRRT